MLSEPEIRRLLTVSRPSRYIGHEVNIVRNPPEEIEVCVALAFPDVYEVGMSHLGLKILYDILNRLPWLAAERVFSPWPDMERRLRQEATPLATLESRRPLHTCDVVGFSVQHELCFTNILNMLDLAGIPFRAAERKAPAPLVIAGGPACFNPEPIAAFFDLIVIGDGETVTPAICDAIRDWKRSGSESKEELLRRLSAFEGVYVPAHFEPHYGPEGNLEAIEPLQAGKAFVQKAIVPDIEAIPYPEEQPVPFTELVHDRLAIEIARGCTRGCRFCQAGMIYRPVRERQPATISRIAEKALSLTGYDDLSLLSLSTGDYSCIEPLLIHLMDRREKDKISVSLPSLRIDSLSPLFMEQIKRVRKTGFTLAIEAGNERLRRIINKGLTDEDILRTAHLVYRADWNLIKLYCMIGLPFETDSDLEDTVKLAREIAAIGGKQSRRNRLNLSVSTFVPKAHTPFMWCAQIPLDEGRRRLHFIQESLRRGPVKVKWNQPEMSWLEGVFSRGDRRLTRSIEAAWRKGARYDAWAEHFNPAIWREAFAETGIDPNLYTERERGLDEILPWDHIRSGVSKAYLKQEWHRAAEALPTPDCRLGCLECGVCDHDVVDPVFAKPWSPPPVPSAHASPARTAPARYLITYSKTGSAALLGHMEFSRAFQRAFRRAHIPLRFSQGFHPLPKVTFTTALPLGTESFDETMVIETDGWLSIDQVTTELNQRLPDGITIKGIRKLDKASPIPRVKSSRYRISFEELELRRSRLDDFSARRHFEVVKKTKKGEHVLDIRPLITTLEFSNLNQLELVILHPEGPQIRPVEVIQSVFGLTDSESAHLHIQKIEQVLM